MISAVPPVFRAQCVYDMKCTEKEWGLRFSSSVLCRLGYAKCRDSRVAVESDDPFRHACRWDFDLGVVTPVALGVWPVYDT